MSVLKRILRFGAQDASTPKTKVPRRLAVDPAAADGTVSSRRLNALGSIIGAERYLEIGVRKGDTIEAVDVPTRVGVDPEPIFDLDRLPTAISVAVEPSDDYFAALDERTRFDLVFVDGLHEFRQSYRDVVNALAHLSPTGVILLDDVVPTSPVAAIPDLDLARAAAAEQGEKLVDWMGDVFRTALAVATLHPELDARTIVDDDGRGQMVIWRRDRSLTGTRAADPTELEALSEIRFKDVFASGVPATLRPATLPDVVSVLRGWLGAPR